MAPNYMSVSPKKKGSDSDAAAPETATPPPATTTPAVPSTTAAATTPAMDNQVRAQSSSTIGMTEVRSAASHGAPTPAQSVLSSSFSSPRIRRHGHASASGRSTGTGTGVDRSLLQKYEDVRHELDRISRMSSQSVDLTECSQEMAQVQKELKKVRRNSIAMIQTQKELLEKMDRAERSSFRRFFTVNRENKMEKLRAKLCEKLSESVEVDQELERLERKSGSLQELRRTSLIAASTSHNNSQIDLELLCKMEELEREKEDILSNLLTSASLPDINQLHSRIAMYSSELKACDCIKKQVDKVAAMYRHALQLLRMALATIVAADYSGTVKEFAFGPYPLTVEAGHLMEAAAHIVQPESCRRYREFAPELLNVRPPKFPQAVTDFARRARTNFDPNSALAVEGMRKLRTAENVILLTQRIALHKLEVIEKWRKDVEHDHERAETAHRKLEARLEEHMATLAQTAAA
ncbi:TPA: hypothetical protein N0F65_002964 [Lagenidium giganteum]|uniref:Uncharacterized protein n=1 Tax=Lagenidium giganteum TaxID=4803 RepID=A0AAV2YLV0_9STRA|nr:TPA: hypothetical protein N0F65_002964 [Lagenidium giganteum]